MLARRLLASALLARTTALSTMVQPKSIKLFYGDVCRFELDPID